jgi:two-component system cell cycle response regulator CpdR
MARILLIDDDVDFRTMLRRRLERAGYAVTEAGNGQEGLKQLNESSVDLVLTDIIMPDMEGVEAVMHLKRTRPELKVIVMSGGGRLTPDSYLKLALKVGAFRALSKPFATEDLLEAVEAALKPSEGLTKE